MYMASVRPHGTMGQSIWPLPFAFLLALPSVLLAMRVASANRVPLFTTVRQSVRSSAVSSQVSLLMCARAMSLLQTSLKRRHGRPRQQYIVHDMHRKLEGQWRVTLQQAYIGKNSINRALLGRCQGRSHPPRWRPCDIFWYDVMGFPLILMTSWDFPVFLCVITLYDVFFMGFSRIFVLSHCMT